MFAQPPGGEAQGGDVPLGPMQPLLRPTGAAAFALSLLICLATSVSADQGNRLARWKGKRDIVSDALGHPVGPECLADIFKAHHHVTAYP